MRHSLAGIFILCSTLSVTQPTAAQTTVYSTFGPNDSYLTNTGLSLFDIPNASQWLAASFFYGGPIGLRLAKVRLAAWGHDFGFGVGDATVLLMSGVDITTAAPIESWVLSGWTTPLAPSIFSFNSVTGNQFVTGETYWLKIINGPSGVMSGAWLTNSQGFQADVRYSTDQGASWAVASDIAPAWDVSAVSAVPEPATIGLVATGLIGIAGFALIRRRRQSRAGTA